MNAAKAAHAAKVDAYTLCVSQAKVADAYIKEQKTQGKVVAPEATPACVNPGPFVPPAEMPAAAAAPAQPAPLLRRNLQRRQPRSRGLDHVQTKAPVGRLCFSGQFPTTGPA